MKAEREHERLVCTSCGVEIEECALCQGRDHETALCYRCMLRALGERTIPESREG